MDRSVLRHPPRRGREFIVAIARIFAQARETPERVAVVHNGVSYIYAELACGIEDARRLLDGQALRPGSLAIVCADSLLESWVLLFALRCLGLSTIAVRNVAQAKPLGLRNVAVVVTSAADDPSRAGEIAAFCGVRAVRVSPISRDLAAGGEIPVARGAQPMPSSARSSESPCTSISSRRCPATTWARSTGARSRKISFAGERARRPTRVLHASSAVSASSCRCAPHFASACAGMRPGRPL